MKIALIATAFCCFSAAALAQPAPPSPPFVPFTVQEPDAKALRSFLDEQPMKFALPLLQWVTGLEQRAVAEAQAQKEKEDKASADAKMKEAQEKAKAAAKPQQAEPPKQGD